MIHSAHLLLRTQEVIVRDGLLFRGLVILPGGVLLFLRDRARVDEDLVQNNKTSYLVLQPYTESGAVCKCIRTGYV